jgi:hypothetical protein
LHFLIQCPEAPWIQNYFFYLLVYNNNTTSIVDPYIFVSLGPTIQGKCQHRKMLCVRGWVQLYRSEISYEKSTHFELRREKELRAR